MVWRSWRISTHKHACFLHSIISKSFDLLDKCFFISFKLEFHINLAIMYSIFFSQVIFIYKCDSIIIFLRKFTLSWSFFFLFHQVYTKYNPSVTSYHIMEMFPSTNAHIINICTYWIILLLHSIGGLGMAKLGFCIQKVGTDPLTCT